MKPRIIDRGRWLVVQVPGDKQYALGIALRAIPYIDRRESRDLGVLLVRSTWSSRVERAVKKVCGVAVEVSG